MNIWQGSFCGELCLRSAFGSLSDGHTKGNSGAGRAYFGMEIHDIRFPVSK